MTTRRRILIVDDDSAMRLPMRLFLSPHGYDIDEASSVKAALEAVRRCPPHLAVLDFSLPDGSGIDLMRTLKAADPALPVFLLTGHGTIDLAVKAMQEGAEQFFTKPVDMPTLQVVLERALENRRNRQASLIRSSKRPMTDPFVGDSAAIHRLREQATRVASAAVPVLIQGETGSGKGVLARWLHESGVRGDEPFVDINCAGISRDLLESELFGYEKGAFTGADEAKPGLLELAHGGTFFLDEIGDVDIAVQAKLLKVIEELRFRRLGDVRDRRVDVRLLAATHRDLERQVAAQRFREDLLYRINTVTLMVPPLRERGSDIVLLARMLLARIAAELGRPGLQLSGAAEGAISAHAWPGNVRQLRNALERAALLSDRTVLEPDDVVPPSLAAPAPIALPPSSLDDSGVASQGAARGVASLDDVERRHIEDVLRKTAGSVPQAAEALGLSRSALYGRMRRLGIVVRRSV